MHHEFRITSLQPRKYLRSEWHISRTARIVSKIKKEKNKTYTMCCAPPWRLSLSSAHIRSCWDEYMFYGSFLGDHLCSPVFDIRGLEFFVGVSRVREKVEACSECKLCCCERVGYRRIQRLVLINVLGIFSTIWKCRQLWHLNLHVLMSQKVNSILIRRANHPFKCLGFVPFQLGPILTSDMR